MTQDDVAERTFTDVNIGRKVRELREKSQLTIMDLAARSGVPAGSATAWTAIPPSSAS